jgi:hypothetical protein
VAELAVRKAQEHTGKVSEYRWNYFLGGGEPEAPAKPAKAVRAPKSATKG